MTSNIKKLATVHDIMVLYNMMNFQSVYSYQHFVLVFM